MEENKTDNFKVPLLPDKPSFIFKKPSASSLSGTIRSDTDSPEEVTTDTVTTVTTTTVEENKKFPVKKSEKSLISVPLPYNEPEWSGHPPSNYNLEIIKNGTFVTNLPINSSLMVFGRLDVCDVVFEHPSVSRYHAVIQYCKGDDTHPEGFYLYDLNSTHGTFLNKEKIKPSIYYKLKVGYILKFGGSSRLHIFQGPEDEDDVVEKKKSASQETDEDICTWGMGDEAEEEEDLAENPFALSTPNEETYIEDPKKTLRGWFEREGYELEYKVEEKGFRTFSCTIKLPIDTASGEYLPVEASVSGKKKEAVIACALEACRTLDRMGLLRQSHHESRQQKRKKWEENDYYDSDEDTFYDRSGEIEKRREMRKRLAKKVEVENFESLTVKLEKLNAEMEEIKGKISASSKTTQNVNSNECDPLDMYMSNLSDAGSTISDKFERRKLKLKLIELEKEKVRLEKLTNIARPTKLPEIKKPTGFIGKKLKSKFTLPSPKDKKILEINKLEDDIVENDSDDDDHVNNSKDLQVKVSEREQKGSSGKYGLILDPSTEVENVATEIQSVESMDCNLSSDTVEILETNNREMCKTKNEVLDPAENTSKICADSENELNMVPPKPNNTKSKKSTKRKDTSGPAVDVYKSSSSEYCTWVPPSNQSGDGRTSLNDKYGY